MRVSRSLLFIALPGIAVFLPACAPVGPEPEPDPAPVEVVRGLDGSGT